MRHPRVISTSSILDLCLIGRFHFKTQVAFNKMAVCVVLLQKASLSMGLKISTFILLLEDMGSDIKLLGALTAFGIPSEYNLIEINGVTLL